MNHDDFKDTKCKLLGYEINSPICIASTAFQRMAHPEGEVAMAKAAEAQDRTTILLSSWSTTPVEKVAEAAPNCLKIFQIYLSKIEAVNKDIWASVKAVGFNALAMTVDTQTLGKRENDVRN